MIFDGHSDIWTDVTVRRCNGEKNVFDRLHYPRMHKGGVEGSIFVIWLDPPFDADPDKRLGEILTAIREDAAESQHLRIVRNMAEAEQALRDGKFYTFIGIEGLDVIGDDLDKLDMLYDFGARHADLTWNGANAFGTGLRGDPDRGLTELGKISHTTVHNSKIEKRKNFIKVHDLQVYSKKLSLIGKCDTVEFYQNSTASYIPFLNGNYDLTIVEHKRNPLDFNDCDIVQITAQVLCLEEMFETNIPIAYIYYTEINKKVSSARSREILSVPSFSGGTPCRAK